MSCCTTLFIGSNEHNCIVQLRWSLKRDICSQRLVEAFDEELDLLCFNDLQVVA
jgi:hypothetical protein